MTPSPLADMSSAYLLRNKVSDRLTDSKVPCTPSAVAEFSLYVDRMPMPTPTPSGVVTEKSAAIRL